MVFAAALTVSGLERIECETMEAVFRLSHTQTGVLAVWQVMVAGVRPIY